MAAEILLALAIRFFIFDFILFDRIRLQLKKTHYVFKKLFSCTFCQGFWCGLFLSLLRHPLFPFWIHIEISFISALLTFTWTVIMDPYIKQYEEHHDIPMV